MTRGYAYGVSVLVPQTILRAGGLGTGGFNFDAKLRRQSIDPEDLFHAHIGGMDAYALADKIARRIIADGKFASLVQASCGCGTSSVWLSSRLVPTTSRRSPET